MSKTNCTISFCDNQLLEKNNSILTASEKQHIRRFRQHPTYAEGIDGVVLTFHRDSRLDMAYVCPCGTKQNCIDGFTIHVRGSMKRKGCPVITKLAKQARFSSKSLYVTSDDDEISFNAKPIDTHGGGGGSNKSGSNTKKSQRLSTTESLDGDDISDEYLSSHDHQRNGSSEFDDVLSIHDIGGRFHASFGSSENSHRSPGKEDLDIQEALERLRKAKAHKDIQRLISQRINRRRVEQ